MTTDGPGPRATLRVAVGAFVAAVTLAATATFNIQAEVVAAWSGLVIAGLGTAEAAWDWHRAGRP